MPQNSIKDKRALSVLHSIIINFKNGKQHNYYNCHCHGLLLVTSITFSYGHHSVIQHEDKIFPKKCRTLTDIGCGDEECGVLWTEKGFMLESLGLWTLVIMCVAVRHTDVLCQLVDVWHRWWTRFKWPTTQRIHLSVSIYWHTTYTTATFGLNENKSSLVHFSSTWLRMGEWFISTVM